MRDGLPLLDADRHVIEPIGLWAEWLPPEHRVGAPYHEDTWGREPLLARVARLGPRGLVPMPPTMMLDGQPVWRGLSERASLELAKAWMKRPGDTGLGATAEAQLHAMDRDGIDEAWLFPSFAGYLVGIESLEPARAAAFARAYNGWLHALCAADPARLHGVGLIARHDPGLMCDELRRVLDLGWRTVVLRPNPVRGRTLGHPDDAPFWSLCEASGVSVALHEGAHARVPAAGADRFSSHFAQIACSHPMEAMMAFLALAESGVFERHPSLRFAFLESGCGWVPYWLHRLDGLASGYPGAEVAETMPRLPSVYFRRQCFVGLEPDEPGIAEFIRQFGSNNLLFGTDFPHLDHAGDLVAQALALGDRIGARALEAVLHHNPRRFFGGCDQKVVNG